MRELVDRLRRRHLETALLAAECARVNRALLRGLCPGLADETTYTTRGKSRWRAEGGLLDARS